MQGFHEALVHQGSRGAGFLHRAYPGSANAAHVEESAHRLLPCVRRALLLLLVWLALAGCIALLLITLQLSNGD